MRILQFSDLHLDAAFPYLPPDKRRIRRNDLRAVLRRALEMAKARDVDLVLIPGDLLEGGLVISETLVSLAESFEEVAPIPIVIAPGNRDIFGPDSPYRVGTEGFPVRRTPGVWPSNVHIFSEPRFETLSLDGVSVTGIAHTGSDRLDNPVLSGLDAPDDGRLHLLVLHGTRVGLPLPRGKETVFPFTTVELITCGFDYAAMGHVHEHSIVEDGKGRILAAYSGSPIALWPDGISRGAVLLAEVERDVGLKPGSIELHDLDPRRSVRVDVTLEDASSREDVRDAVRAAVRPMSDPGDIVSVTIKGRLDPEILLNGQRELAFLGSEGLAFHASLVNRTEPAYDLESIRRDRESTRGAFVDSLLEELASAEKEPATDREALEEGLVYGLDAFSGREVQRRDRGDS